MYLCKQQHITVIWFSSEINLKLHLIYITFQVTLTDLHILFVGILEPHSVIVAQYYALGTCKWCDDIIPEHQISISKGKHEIIMNKHRLSII